MLSHSTVEARSAGVQCLGLGLETMNLPLSSLVGRLVISQRRVRLQVLEFRAGTGFGGILLDTGRRSGEVYVARSLAISGSRIAGLLISTCVSARMAHSHHDLI